MTEPMTPRTMVTDEQAHNWREGNEAVRALLDDRKRMLALLIESRRLMPILHMNYCPEAHQGGECDCGGDARAKWGEETDKALKEAGR